MKKWISAALALCLALSLCAPALAATNSMDNFKPSATYANNFKDVPATHWAAGAIKTCYEYGLMNGTANGFNPAGELTVAEALVMADRVHEIFTTGQSTLTNGSPWYQPYVDYAIDKGIVDATDFDSYTAKATRAQMAYIFCNALPESALPAINHVEYAPDILESRYFEEILMLYNAGVLTGSDIYGTFKPNNTITRAEAAAIISRVAIAKERKNVVLLNDWAWGDDVVLAMPQGAEEIPGDDAEMQLFGAVHPASISMVVLGATQDAAYRGANITLIPAGELNQALLDSLAGENMTLSDLKSVQVSFGAVKAYRSTATTKVEGETLHCVIYSYIIGDELDIIMLMSTDEGTLRSMANAVRVANSSVSPKL